MRKFLLMSVLCGGVLGSFTPATAVWGQTETPSTVALPPIVLNGLNDYKTSGPEEAVKTWFKGSSMDLENTGASAVTELKRTQEQLGAYLSYDVVTIRTISARTLVVYIALNYEKEPRFAKFVAYRGGHGWILIDYHLGGDLNWLGAELK
ncbi:MAG TPA: hypothetical protein VHZ52_08070 [Acidobacteriaceae bacterium]|nr:hypothetical protein [Acidobacteriaceae bacterium]